jgi:Flp pilus assembly protein TadB
MSSPRRSSDASRSQGVAAQPARDPSQPHARRRREALRARHLARVDLGIGLSAAIALLIIAPGLAIAALVALAVLILCGLSLVVERRRRRAARRRLRAAGASSSRPDPNGLGDRPSRSHRDPPRGASRSR